MDRVVKYTFRISNPNAPNCDITEEVITQDYVSARDSIRGKYGSVVSIKLLNEEPMTVHKFIMSVNEAKESLSKIIDKNTNDVIWAIKVFRALTGCDLVTAKNAVLEILNRDFCGNPLRASSEFRGELSNKE